MAIVKVTYTRSRPKIKAHLRYIAHRPGREGEKISRSLFDLTGLSDKDQAYRLIDDAPRGSIFFKTIVSPDPKWEDSNNDSVVVICHTGTPMLPLGQPKYPDQDKGVCDGTAHC